jgi:hypothetical protein
MIIQDLDYQKTVQSSEASIEGGLSFTIPASVFPVIGQFLPLVPAQFKPFIAPVVQQVTVVLSGFGITFENLPPFL